MRIAVADDNAVFAQKIEKAVGDYFTERKISATVDVFSDGNYLLADIGDDKNYDIYLLDIEMPGTDGFKAAECIRRWDRKAWIVFITSHEKYALKGYRYQVCSYILKEKYAEQLPQALDYILESDRDDQEEHYQIMNEQKYERFPVRDILYLKKEGKNTVFYCRKGACYHERAALETIYKRLNQDEFMYVNRGEIVSLRHVTGLKGGNIELYDTSLPVSRYLLSQVKQTLQRYWGKEK